MHLLKFDQKGNEQGSRSSTSLAMAGHNGHLGNGWRRLRWPRSRQFLSSLDKPVHVWLHGARRLRRRRLEWRQKDDQQDDQYHRHERTS